MSNLYKWLWSKIGGRPWTYILRDVWHEAEWVWQLVVYSVGVAVGHYFSWRTAYIAFGIYTLGYIAGHLFWGTNWIRGQRGK